MSFFVDLHVHTLVGSPDSGIRPEGLADRLRILGDLDGVVLAEHSAKWSPADADKLQQSTDAFVVNAREYDTDWGHVIVVGVPEEDVRGVRKAAQLRDVVSSSGGLMIAAHPFRYFPGSGSLLFPESDHGWLSGGLGPGTLGALAAHPIFQVVDAVEVLNQGSTNQENRLAFAVASRLGLPGVGGSDAHDIYSIGRHATEFKDRLRCEQDLIDAIRSGGCFGVRKAGGGYVRAGDSDPAAMRFHW